MSVLPRTRAAAAVVAAGLLLAGCGSGGGPATSTTAGPAPAAAAGPSTSAAPSTPPAPETSPGASAPEPSEPVELPWPAPGASDAGALQAAVDGGAQPWLLDPSEVATSYAAAAYGWNDAQATPGPDGTTVVIRAADGQQRSLTLAQPGRGGQGGIWVVTADRPA